MSNKIDPNLLAAGIGGLFGANTMSTGDNDLVATTVGAAIGIGTGAMLDLNISEKDKLKISKASNELETIIDPDQVSKNSKTFSEKKAEVKNLAEKIANKSKSIVEFDREKPFSTLNRESIGDFLLDLENVESEESLNKLKIALTTGKDDLFLNSKELDPSLKVADVPGIKITAGASLAEKMGALKTELVRLGYEDGSEELENKLNMFKGMMDGYGHSEQITIRDGKLQLSKDITINLTYKSVGENGDVATQFVSNKNIYNVPKVSFTASSFLLGKDVKAVADALGITMADAFKEQMEREMNGVAGLAPDEAAAVAYNRLKDKPDQFKQLVQSLNGMAVHDVEASGAYKFNLMNGNNTKPAPDDKAISISNTVDYEHTLNYNDDGSLNTQKPFTKLQTNPKKGKRAAVKEFVEKKVLQTGIPNYGISADHATQMTTTLMEKQVGNQSGKYTYVPSKGNKVLSVHTSPERNPVSVYNRDTSHTTGKKALPFENAFDFLLKQAGAEQQFASAMPLQTHSINTSLNVTDTGGKTGSTSFVNMLGDIFGADHVVSDGSGLANADVLGKIKSEGYVNIGITPTADKTLLFADENYKKLASGEMSFNEFKEGAKKGVSVIQGRSDKAIKDVRSNLNTLQSAISTGGGDAKAVLADIQKKMPKFYKEHQAKLSKMKEVSEIQEFGQRKLMRSLPKVDNLYSNKNPMRSQSAVTAREQTRISYRKLQESTDDLETTIKNLDSFIETNNQNKEFRGMAESFFPKANHVVGYNPDGSEVKVKKNFQNVEMAGAFWNNAETKYGEYLDFGLMFKGTNVVGDANEVKSYGLGTKAQLQMRTADAISKTVMLEDFAKEERLSYDSKKRTINLKVDDNNSISFSYNDLKNKSFEQIFKERDIEMPEEWKEKVNRYKNIAVLAEDESSGTKKHADLLEALKKGEDVSGRSSSKFLGDYIQARATALRGDDKALAGLADFMMATSQDKSAIDYLMNAHLSTIQQSGLKFSQYTKTVGAERDAAEQELRRFSRESLGVELKPGTISADDFGQAVSSRLQSVLQYHTLDGFLDNFFDLAKNTNTLDSFADFFINERRHRDPSLGDSLIKPTALGNLIEHELGSGSTGKNASWNSMAQLRMSGFTNEDIGLFGKMSAHNVADYQAVSMLTKHLQNSVNEDLSDNDIKKVLNLTPNKRRTALEEKGHSVKDLVANYSLRSENELGLKSLPILLEDSRLFGDYTDKEGFVQQKKLHASIETAIRADMRATNASTETERKAALNTLNEELKYITSSILPSLGGQDNAIKKLATLEAPHSIYSVATPVSGGIRRHAVEELNNHHVVAVNSRGLLTRLKEMGQEFNTIEDIKKAGLLKKTGQRGVYEIFLDKEHKLPMFSMLTREPSVGMGSTTSVKYLLDTNLGGDEKNLYSIFDSLVNKNFKFQDFDMDHFIELFPKLDKTNYDHLLEVFNKGKEVNKQLDKMVDFASKLGVKGKDRDKLRTYFDIIENPEVKTKEDFINAFNEDVSLSKSKGMDRKIISPTVTKLAFSLNEALMQNEELSFDQMSRARIMSHYLIENLLKSQHISNETHKKEPIPIATQLAEALEGNRIDRFNELFGNYIEDNIIKARRADKGGLSIDIEDSIRETYRNIQKSVSEATITGDITPAHLKAARVDDSTTVEDLKKAIHSSITSIDNLASGESSKIGVVSTAHRQVVNPENASVVSRAKKSYHKSLETAKHVVANNKKLLAGAAAATIGAALLTQEKPNFGNQTVSANTNGMLLEASRNAIQETASEQSIMGGVHRATEYVHSYQKGGSRSISVEGHQTGYGSSGDLQQDVNNFMFGDGMNSIRILTN